MQTRADEMQSRADEMQSRLAGVADVLSPAAEGSANISADAAEGEGWWDDFRRRRGKGEGALRTQRLSLIHI